MIRETHTINMERLKFMCHAYCRAHAKDAMTHPRRKCPGHGDDGQSYCLQVWFDANGNIPPADLDFSSDVVKTPVLHLRSTNDVPPEEEEAVVEAVVVVADAVDAVDAVDEEAVVVVQHAVDDEEEDEEEAVVVGDVVLDDVSPPIMLSPYELIRANRVAGNNAELVRLGLMDTETEARDNAKARGESPPLPSVPNPKKRKTRRAATKETTPASRISLRLQALSNDPNQAEENVDQTSELATVDVVEVESHLSSGKPYPDQHQRRWNKYYNLLCAYKQTYHDVRVRHQYCSPCGARLGVWVCTQRSVKNGTTQRAIKAGKRGTNTMLAARQLRLEELGFVWEQRTWFCLVGKQLPKPTRTVYSEYDTEDTHTPHQQRLWNKNYNLLCAYKQTYHDVRVRQQYRSPCGARLGIWVNTQRLAKAGIRGTMSAARQLRLEELGFLWKESQHHPDNAGSL
jgi:hypothetical protein